MYKRQAYDKLAEEQKKHITNYEKLVQMEKRIAELKEENSNADSEQPDISDGTEPGREGTPAVSYTHLSSPEDDGETNDGKKEDANPLEEGSADVTAFMHSYYTALGERDIATLRTLVSDLTASDESRITNAKDYIEAYTPGNVYTKKGLDDNSYVVYTCYSYVCTGIDTPVPSLGYAYVVKDSKNIYKILGAADQNTKISAYMENLLNDADVQQLRAKVQAEYDACLLYTSIYKSLKYS